jgi:hypothetical protein
MWQYFKISNYYTYLMLSNPVLCILFYRVKNNVALLYPGSSSDNFDLYTAVA